MRLVKYLLLAAAAFAFAAYAQLRAIPAEAKPATMRHLQDMIVELNGKPARLSPGAQIRDTFNRLVLPAAMVDRAMVKYLPDSAGMVHRVWILSSEEGAQIPRLLPAPAPKPAPKKDEKAKD